MRAKHEYGRMVEGCRKLAADHEIYFATLTCRGDETPEQSEAHYYERTNALLSAWRYQTKRSGSFWAYAAVTERQKRGNPHSHIISTFAPPDVFSPFHRYKDYCASIARINAQIALPARFSPIPHADLSFLDLHSEWLMLAAWKAGLGVQARLSIVDTVEGASRYVAKYLFKDTIFTRWRPGWKRIRYSQSFPKLPEPEATSAYPLIRSGDWSRAAREDGLLICSDEQVYETALLHLCMNACYGGS